MEGNLVSLRPDNGVDTEARGVETGTWTLDAWNGEEGVETGAWMLDAWNGEEGVVVEAADKDLPAWVPPDGTDSMSSSSPRPRASAPLRYLRSISKRNRDGVSYSWRPYRYLFLAKESRQRFLALVIAT